jgi:pimeloyl-ACP methyl ester carboxylesterase
MREHIKTGFVQALTWVIFFSSASLAGCDRSGTPSLRSVATAACHLKGIDTELRCATIEVPENRMAHPPGRTVKLWFAVNPAISRNALDDPVVVIAGGPGQSASSVAGVIMPLFAKLNRTRDVIFLDQRGTGHSQALDCAPPKGIDDLASQLNPDLMVATLPGCARGFVERGIDVTHYLTEDAAGDLDDLRRALGYDKLNLWGASYGTRVALEYLREFPDKVRSVVLDGAAPSSLHLPIDLAIDADQSLSATIALCKKDDLCNRLHPGLNAALDQLFLRLNQGKEIAHISDPVTGNMANIPFGTDTFAAWLRTPLYNALTTSLVPEAVADAATGDYDVLAALNLSVSGDVFDQLSLGMHLSVVCSEDMSGVSPAMIDATLQTRFQDSFYRFYQRMCHDWPTRFVEPVFFTDVKANAPVLILAGGRDPATPPRHARPLLAGLPNAKLIVAKNLGHGISLAACAPDLIDQFIREASAKNLDGSCLENLPAPPFFVPPLAKFSQ